MHLWPRRPAQPTFAQIQATVQPEPAPVGLVELVFTTDELGGLETRLRAALPVTDVGPLRTPATLANAVRLVSREAGGEPRVEVSRRPAVLKAAESWEVRLWDVPGPARQRLSSVLGRSI